VINSLFLGLLDETLVCLSGLSGSGAVVDGSLVRLKSAAAKNLAKQLAIALRKVRNCVAARPKHRYKAGFLLETILSSLQRFNRELHGGNRALAICMVLDPRTTRLQSGTGVAPGCEAIFTDAYREEALKVRPAAAGLHRTNTRCNPELLLYHLLLPLPGS
jgi:hypothetical protein